MSNYQRLINILMLMTQRETTDFLWDKRRRNRLFLKDFISHLSLEVTGRNDLHLVRALELYFANLRDSKNPEDPKDLTSFECVGCENFEEAEGLRWKKLNDGGFLTVSVDHSNKPIGLSWLTDEEILTHWFKPWADENEKIRFRFLETGRGDIHITFDDFEGPEEVFMIAWQPVEPAEFMELAGEISGDIVVRSTHNNYPVPLTRIGGKHEVGHALGLHHSKLKGAVMWDTATNVNKPLHKDDKEQLNKRYPKSE